MLSQDRHEYRLNSGSSLASLSLDLNHKLKIGLLCGSIVISSGFLGIWTKKDSEATSGLSKKVCGDPLVMSATAMGQRVTVCLMCLLSLF